MTSVHTFPYDEMHDPAMPVVEMVLVSPADDQESEPVSALVDSGSDGTSIPIDYLDEIGALSIGTAIMSGIWGERRRVNLYLIHIRIGSHFLRAIRVAGVPNEMGCILGRNVLNQLEITLNGPANAIEISASME